MTLWIVVDEINPTNNDVDVCQVLSGSPPWSSDRRSIISSNDFWWVQGLYRGPNNPKYCLILGKSGFSREVRASEKQSGFLVFEVTGSEKAKRWLQPPHHWFFLCQFHRLMIGILDLFCHI